MNCRVCFLNIPGVNVIKSFMKMLELRRSDVKDHIVVSLEFSTKRFSMRFQTSSDSYVAANSLNMKKIFSTAMVVPNVATLAIAAV